MKIHRGLQTIRTPLEQCTVAIGRFDGVHVGHQALIGKAVQCARERGISSVVFTFDRHPAELLAPDRAPFSLTTTDRQAELIEALGADHLMVAEFDWQFSSLSAESFMHFVLCGVLGAKEVFVGEDFRFGSMQSGDVAALIEAEHRLGFHTHVVSAINVDGEKASSSRARNLLLAGDLDGAQAILGRPHRLSGIVGHGAELGRTIGFPTANLEVEGRLLVPANGIYAVRARVGGKELTGACSVGTRPTVDGVGRTVETYMFDFSGDIYDHRLEIDFIARLRDELKFASVEKMVEQIHLDVEECRQILSA
ncbi:MAG: bifunctional riboflavin kinase/FAD synthetase [Chthonomonadales bacterium]